MRSKGGGYFEHAFQEGVQSLRMSHYRFFSFSPGKQIQLPFRFWINTLRFSLTPKLETDLSNANEPSNGQSAVASNPLLLPQDSAENHGLNAGQDDGRLLADAALTAPAAVGPSSTAPLTSYSGPDAGHRATAASCPSAGTGGALNGGLQGASGLEPSARRQGLPAAARPHKVVAPVGHTAAAEPKHPAMLPDGGAVPSAGLMSESSAGGTLPLADTALARHVMVGAGGGEKGGEEAAGSALEAWVRSETTGDLGAEAAARLGRRLVEQDLTSVALLAALGPDELLQAAGSVGAGVALRCALGRMAPRPRLQRKGHQCPTAHSATPSAPPPIPACPLSCSKEQPRYLDTAPRAYRLHVLYSSDYKIASIRPVSRSRSDARTTAQTPPRRPHRIDAR